MSPPVLKIGLGFEQSWIVIELCLRIRHTIKLATMPPALITRQSIYDAHKKTDCKVKYGQVISSFMILGFTVSSLIALIVKGQQLDDIHDRMNWVSHALNDYIIPMLLMTFALLTVSIISLTFLLNRQQKLFDATQD